METWFSYRKRILLSIAIALFNCSSVEKVNVPPKVFQEPYYKPLAESSSDFIFRESESDYKIRKDGHSLPVLAFSPVHYPKSVDGKLATYFEQELGLVWNLAKFTRVKIQKSAWENPEILQAECKKSGVDAIANLKVSDAENGWDFKYELVDPIDGTVFGEFDTSFKKVSPGQNGGGAWSQVFFWKTPESIISLDQKSAIVPIWDKKLELTKISQALDLSISGSVTIRSSSSETDVIWKNKKLGHTPITDLQVPEGVQEFQLSLKGKKPVTKKIQVRSGKKISLYQEWEDDKTLGSAKIVSSPEGLAVSLDGFKQGETPFFRSNLTPGVYQIELIKENVDKALVYFEGNLEVQPDKISEIALPYSSSGLLGDLEFWKASGDGGFSSHSSTEVDFRKTKNLSPGWNGVYSLPLVADELEATGIFSSPIEFGSGVVAFSFHCQGLTIGVEANKDHVNVFKFPSDGKSIGTFKYKTEDKEYGRPFSFRTNSKDKKLEVYLGQNRIWEGPIPFQGNWTLSILTRGDDFHEALPLKDLKIHYRGYK
ncbi:PEGA domain protein [Leptospira perolatii]|uniref:PEGA domain protein n=1 Tax=Leptospira perolatii TaxID=2023191 RepID=A0A2M9ZRH8_9LEPT|nr:PEGA domain-containing protein [Leptospira perolatii]PJZ71112.1 PEGA domain protein [Leptospira perolatii]PJZ74644.1 PEGA domain protein [Leptospira perolatii]